MATITYSTMVSTSAKREADFLANDIIDWNWFDQLAIDEENAKCMASYRNWHEDDDLENLIWLAEQEKLPADQRSESYSDIFKDVWGFRPRY